MVEQLWLVHGEGTNPHRNLGLEEALTLGAAPGACILYLWQNRRTVVIGRNQNAWKECHVARLEADGGFLARRLSGGGAVFHDLGNLNFTFIAREDGYDVGRQMEVVLRAVRALGIPAEKSGRNDITVEGRKISGNAFYSTGGRCCHHGTLLLRADMDQLSRYLNVAPDKLRSKGVDSVRARVGNLRDFCPEATVERMRAELETAFGEVYGLAPAPLPIGEALRGEARQCAAKFASEEWRYGRRIPFDCELSHRFAWGDLQMQFHINGGRVAQAAVWSAALDGGFIAALPAALEGCFFSPRALAGALDGQIPPDGPARAALAEIRDWLLEQNL